MDADGAPFLTDDRNPYLHVAFPPEALADPCALDTKLRALPGVVETGIFVPTPCSYAPKKATMIDWVDCSVQTSRSSVRMSYNSAALRCAAPMRLTLRIQHYCHWDRRSGWRRKFSSQKWTVRLWFRQN